MRIWFDTEFIEDGHTIDLLSIGMVREDGESLYRQSAACDQSRASDWVKVNVLPHLTGEYHTRDSIKADVLDFCGEKPEIWAYYADYDWVALCQLFGLMIDLPRGWPRYCRDLKQEADRLGTRFPKAAREHNALDDALWCKQMWERLQGEEKNPNA